MIEIPPAYAEPPVSVRSALSLSVSIRSTLSLSGSVGSRRPGPYPPPLSYQLVFWVQIVVHQPHTMFSTMPQLYFPPGMRSKGGRLSFSLPTGNCSPDSSDRVG